MNLITVIFLGTFGTNEIFIIAILALLLFGGKKIPELMRGLGTGVREFKKATQEDNKKEDNEKEDNEKKDNEKENNKKNKSNK